MSITETANVAISSLTDLMAFLRSNCLKIITTNEFMLRKRHNSLITLRSHSHGAGFGILNTHQNQFVNIICQLPLEHPTYILHLFDT